MVEWLEVHDFDMRSKVVGLILRAISLSFQVAKKIANKTYLG